MIWKVFTRLPSDWKDSEDYARECFQAGVIAIGWSELGDLKKIVTREELVQKLKKGWSAEARGKPQKIAQWAGSLWAFKEKIKTGHWVICPDRESGKYYVGRVTSDKVHYRITPLGGRCDFAHRREVRWKNKALRPEEAQKLFGDAFGGNQTVSRISDDPSKLKKYLAKAKKQLSAHKILPTRPDMEWGQAAEARAMKWLKSRGYDPKNVAHLCLGWDIECGEEKFEVKGRRSPKVAIRLSQNEMKAARQHKANYTLLIFTEATLARLKKAIPNQIPDPSETELWKRRVVYEYLLFE